MADITLDEFESAMAEEEQETTNAAAAAANPPAPAADSSVPDRFRGKSLSEIVAHAEATERALRISEEARVSRPAQPTPVEPAEKELTREELQELIQTEPLAAMEYITARERRNAEANIERRLSGLQHGTISQAENQARQAYALEFELFGDQITEFVNRMPDKTAFTSVNGWKDVVSYVRGLDGNLDKYIERKTSGQSEEQQRTTAREDQVRKSGPTFTTRTAAPAPRGNGASVQMDEVTRKIAQEFVDAGTFKSVDEYVKWSQMNNG